MKKSRERCVRRWQMTPYPLTTAGGLPPYAWMWVWVGDIQPRIDDAGNHTSSPPHFRKWVSGLVDVRVGG